MITCGGRSSESGFQGAAAPTSGTLDPHGGARRATPLSVWHYGHTLLELLRGVTQYSNDPWHAMMLTSMIGRRCVRAAPRWPQHTSTHPGPDQLGPAQGATKVQVGSRPEGTR